jgi:hypothetical protein
VPDVVHGLVVAVEEVERLGAGPEPGVGVVERVVRVEGLGVRGVFEAERVEVVRGAAPAQLLHVAGGVHERAHVHLLGEQRVGPERFGAGRLMAQGLAHQVGEFRGVGDRETADHDLGGEVDVAAVLAVGHLAIEPVAVLVEGARHAAVVDRVGGDVRGARHEKVLEGDVELLYGDEVVGAGDEQIADAPLLIGVLDEGADAGGRVRARVVGADPLDRDHHRREPGAGAGVAERLEVPRRGRVVEQVRRRDDEIGVVFGAVERRGRQGRPGESALGRRRVGRGREGGGDGEGAGREQQVAPGIETHRRQLNRES